MRTRPNPIYRLLHRDYHESFDCYAPQRSDFHALVSGKLPSGWRIDRRGIWFQCGSLQTVMPQQGWKIHISATPANARDILDRVTEKLFERKDTGFKFAVDLSTLGLLNGKNWSRGGSAKFITIYPPDNGRFLELLEELHNVTRDLRGPYILSDHRYRDSSVVFYRYGGMQLHEVLNVRGERIPMLVGPNGSEVPDQRMAYPVTPSWVENPLPGNETQKKAGEGNTLKDGRFRIESVFEFSSAGGIYLAVDQQTVMRVVIKEARPHINEMPAGNDAIELLKKEHRLLTLLADDTIAPRPVDLFQEWEHWFLVEEYIPGTSMSAHSAANNALLRTRPSSDDYKTWADMFRVLALRLIEIVSVLHSRQIVFADLSPNNLIIPAGTKDLKLIDFEGAYQIGTDRTTALYTPGFVSHKRLAGSTATLEDDYYSLGAVLFAYLFPVNGLFHLNPEAKQEIMACIQNDAHLPRSVGEMVLALMDQNTTWRPASTKMIEILKAGSTASHKMSAQSSRTDYHALLEGIVEHTQGVASYNRRDKLFPADPKLFATNPLSLAYGAGGVAYMLERVTGKSPDSAVDWILSHTISRETYAPGLYIGMSGIAWVLLEMGQHQEAAKIFQLTSGHPLLHHSFDVFYGTAGWGMTNLRFFLATGNELYLDQARQAGEKLLEPGNGAGSWRLWEQPTQRPLGFAHGASGVSLFLLYLSLATHDDRFLVAGQEALDLDLSSGMNTRDGGMSWGAAVELPKTLYPYWRYGSAGLGTALVRFYKLLGETRYSSILEKIFIDTDRKYSVLPGHFIGLAGLGSFLLDTWEFTGESRYLESAHKVAAGIMNFRVNRRGIAFPGDFLSRLSCDYGTGSAGIALFLNRLAGRQQGGDFMLDGLFGVIPATTRLSRRLDQEKLVPTAMA